jgi:hypothetical protein
MGVRIQVRDGNVGKHLYRARMLTTRQLAVLEFGGKVDAARRRLYVLNSDLVQSLGFSVGVEPGTGERTKNGEGMVWRLSKEYFQAYACKEDDHPDKKYPGPLRDRGDVAHLIATNELYVRVAPALDGGHIPGLYPEDWGWLCEPFCHRHYRTGFGPFKLTPDAEVRVFGTTFLIERQTSAARKKPEAIHDKVFRYHRYANSDHRRAGAEELVLAWACDAERDVRAALDAGFRHPTKGPAELRMGEHDRRRMPVFAGTPEEVANTILATAKAHGALPEVR